MSLYVDADACPVKEECLRAAERLGVPAFLVCNGGLRPSAHPLVEVVFVYPGLGQLLVDSVAKRDFPVVQAACLIFAATYILLNLAADLIAILSNPRLLHPR